MPDINGIQFYKNLTETTGYIHYRFAKISCAEGFNVDAVDYLWSLLNTIAFLKADYKAKEYLEFLSRRNCN